MPEYDEQGNPAEVTAAILEGARENYNALMEAAVRRATDAVCDFDPDAAAYRMRTEAWVRLALTVALRPPSASLSGQDETTKGRDDG